MKKIISTGILLVFTHQVFSQSTSASNALSGSLPSSPTQYLGSANAADVLFKSNGVERMRILSSGNIGIGTSTPVTALNITTSASNDGLRIIQNGNTAAAAGLFNSSVGGHNWVMFSLGSGNSEGAGNFGLYDYTSSAYRLFIKGTNGYIGIGTITPQYLLDINGAARVSGTLIAGTATVSSLSSTGSLSATSISVSGAGTFSGDITSTGNISASGINVTSNSTFSGTLRNVTLAGSGNRVITADGSGNLIALSGGKSDEVLHGDGTWLALPSTTFTKSGTSAYFTGGNIGIGTTSPAYPLEVFGDARMANGLTVTGNFSTNGTAVFSSSISSPVLKIGTPTDNLSIIEGTTTEGAKVFLFNGGVASSAPMCIPSFATTPGALQPTRLAIVPATTITSTNLLDFRNDGTTGFIEYAHNSAGNPPEDFGANPWPTLKINSACNGNVEIAKGGGYVSTGNSFEAGNPPTRSASITSNIYAASARIGQRITTSHSNLPNTTFYNTQLFVNKDVTHALSVFSTYVNGGGFEAFTVYGTGKTEIKVLDPVNNPNALDIVDASNNKINFRIKADGRVYAREINVMAPTNAFPDYVFAKNYKLMPLMEVEKYIAANQHLPNIPAAKEVEANGINVSDLQIKQMEKIEEIYLYIIELKKENEVLKERIGELENK